METTETLPVKRALGEQAELLLLPNDRFKKPTARLAFDLPLDGREPTFHLLARVLEQGTAALPSQQALTRRRQELYGASVGVGVGRVAERLRFSAAASWVGERFLPEGVSVQSDCLALLASLLENPIHGPADEPLHPDVVERERANLLAEVRARKEDRSVYAEERCLEEMCAGEPCGRPEPATEAEVAAISIDDLEDARHAILETASVSGVAVGALDADALNDQLAAWLGGASGRKPVPDPDVRSAGELRRVTEEMELDQARFVFGFRVEPATTIAQTEACLLANAVLGGGAYGRLFQIVREERSLCYGIYSQLRLKKGLLLVEAGLAADRIDEVREEVLKQVEIVAQGGFEEEQLNMARLRALNDLRSVGDTATGLAAHWEREHLLGFHRSPGERAADVAAIEPEQVATAARGWAPDLLYTLVTP